MDKPPREDLPSELRAFLYSCIDSIEQLDMLMLLRRSDRPKTTREVAAALTLSDSLTRAQLDMLTARGLLDARPGAEVTYRVEPKTADLARYVVLLEEAYASSRSAVVRFIATRSRRTKSFSDAFKLRDPE